MTKRARDLGVRFPGPAGKPNNAITDVPGVGVGHSTIIAGQLVPQPSLSEEVLTDKAAVQADADAAVDTAVNTRVMVVIPESGLAFDSVVNCGFVSLNGNGEMTGTYLIEESGILQGPLVLKNTACLRSVRSLIIEYGLKNKIEGYLLPVIAETDDSLLNNVDPGGTGAITSRMLEGVNC